MTYSCETRVLTKDCRKKIFAFERKCCRKLLRISWTQKVTNKELFDKIGQEHNLPQTMIERKPQLFGHICRMSDDRKLKILLFGKMDGKNKRGRPHREWTDNIVEWCG